MQLDTKIAELILREQNYISGTNDYKNGIQLDNRVWKSVVGEFPFVGCQNLFHINSPIFNCYSYNANPDINIYHYGTNIVLICTYWEYALYEVDDLAEEFLGDLFKFATDLVQDKANLTAKGKNAILNRISSFARQIPKAALSTD